MMTDAEGFLSGSLFLQRNAGISLEDARRMYRNAVNLEKTAANDVLMAIEKLREAEEYYKAAETFADETSQLLLELASLPDA